MMAPGGCRSWAEKALFEDTSLGDIGQNGPTPAGRRNRAALAADLKEEKLSGARDDPVIVGLHDSLTAPGNQTKEVQRPNCLADGAFDIDHEDAFPRVCLRGRAGVRCFAFTTPDAPKDGSLQLPARRQQ